MLKKFLLVTLCAVSIVNASDGLTVSEKVLLRKETVAQTPWTSGLEKLARSVTKEKLKKAAALGALIGAKSYAFNYRINKIYLSGVVLADALVNRAYNVTLSEQIMSNVFREFGNSLKNKQNTLRRKIFLSVMNGAVFSLLSLGTRKSIDYVAHRVPTLKKYLGK